ncbi:diaminopropionate ammonia-lyase [Salinicoccus sp. Marseille-QA3877]
MEWIQNKFKDHTNVKKFTPDFSMENMEKVNNLHKSMPQYEKTPLYKLTKRSNEMGLGALFVKDESPRFCLNAFKGLGVSYAMASYFAGKLNQDIADLTFNELLEQVSEFPPETFATATEGNHGKGVAWGADIFNQKGKVFLPKGAAKSRVDAVTDLGAEAKVTDINYDDTVQYAADQSSGNGWILLQDTAWEGYEKIPTNIMQGYTTIISEITEQLESENLEQVTHVILQAGVGSFAGAMSAAIHNITGGNPPKIIVVEPTEANPILRSADSELGNPVRVYGAMDTTMAGLSCGEPSPIGWNILKSTADYFISCKDEISDKGMRILGRPIEGDTKITSGASGALPAGFLHEVMTNDSYADLKEKLKLGSDSKVLVINTEGNTDPDNYQRVMNG